MNSKFYINTVVASALILSANARADEIVDSAPAQGGSAGIVLSVGDCVLSVQHLYKRATASGCFAVIPLAEAKSDSSCRKLTDYSEVDKAYAALAQQAPNEEVRIAPSTNAKFTRDTSNAALGEAYRDPSNLIWGDVVKDGQMRFEDAFRYCKSIGARLPTEDDFVQLAKYLGKGFGKGYNPNFSVNKTDILPGLSTYWFWSSSVNSDESDLAFVLNGFSGDVFSDYRSYHNAVRCVSGR